MLIFSKRQTGFEPVIHLRRKENRGFRAVILYIHAPIHARYLLFAADTYPYEVLLYSFVDTCFLKYLSNPSFKIRH